MIQFRTQSSSIALFNLAFRPFFLCAGIFSVVSVLFWTALYGFQFSLPMDGLATYKWHAHEMVFGYSMAVIAGFLLTAVKNWTGIQTIHGPALALLVILWLVARILFLAGSTYIHLACIFDLLFVVYLMGAFTWPVVKARNWRQLGIMAKILLLAAANLCFYLGYKGILEQGMYWGIYGGLYLVISLILTMGNRVIPFFIERGVGYPVELPRPKWITILSLLLFIIFFISELFLHNNIVSGCAAAGLFVVNAIRLYYWHTPGIWKKPLLWSLYMAIVFIVAGFLLFALSTFTDISKFLAIHAFAYGGIGMITLSMMARVSLGHTGRNINEPPATVFYTLLLLSAGVIFRVILPIIDTQHYVAWLIISQTLWAVAFLLFVISYTLILIKPRVDGLFG